MPRPEGVEFAVLVREERVAADESRHHVVHPEHEALQRAKRESTKKVVLPFELGTEARSRQQRRCIDIPQKLSSAPLLTSKLNEMRYIATFRRHRLGR